MSAPHPDPLQIFHEHIHSLQHAPMAAPLSPASADDVLASSVAPLPSLAASAAAAPALPRNASKEWVGLPALIAKHAAQIATFEAHLAASHFRKIHRAHYDWWFVPIDALQSMHGQAYSIFAEEIAQLKADHAFMQRWRRGVELMALAWGWDLAAARDIPQSQRSPGQEWADWPIRLWKMARSAQLLGEDKIFLSLRAYGRQLIKAKHEFTFGKMDLKPMFA